MAEAKFLELGMPMFRERKSLLKFLFILCLCLAALLLILVLLMPAGASEEYRYTVQVIFQFAFPVLILGAITCFLFWKGKDSADKLAKSRAALIVFLIAGTILVFIPILSPNASLLDWKYALAFSFCWFLGSLLVSLGLFMLAAHINNFISGLICLAASVILAFSVCELGFLATSQTLDGRFVDNVHSKYVESGEAVAHMPMRDTAVGIFPEKPDTPQGAYAHKEMRFGQTLFDAKYTFDQMNRRIMPKADAHPAADLLTFGCSFTFGYALQDEQTWPWLLAKDLGPSWKVENYAYNGFGAQQMLAMLEEKMIEPPAAPVRQAIFLAIQDQIRRNSGLFYLDSITYKLENGKLVRGPKTYASKLLALYKLPEFFNGSQFVREMCRMIMYKIAAIMNPKHTELYIAIIAGSAKLLKEQYQTQLTVLLWPDNENIAPALKEKGIPVLFAREMLKEWGKGDSPNYHIVPHLESHPNVQATQELARGIAEYYAPMIRQEGYSPAAE